METKHVDIIIVGAGLIGSALALALANQASANSETPTKRARANKKTPLNIAVIEHASQITENKIPNQRVVALGKVATDLLKKIGVLEQLGAAFCNPYDSMFVWDEHSHGELSFNAKDQGLPMLGSMVDSVQCTLLMQQKMAQEPSIATHYECATQKLEFNDQRATSRNSSQTKVAQLHLKDQIISAPLIVAADGAKSWLRNQAKIFANHRSYEQQGIVARVQTQEPHRNTAWQRFLSTGPIALLPVEKNQSSIVWSAENERSDELMALSDAEFEKQLAQALGFKLGAVELLTKRQAFPLVSQQAERYFSRHIVLVGDAAHSIHPLAGQGANLGFKDVQALVKVIASRKPDELSDIALLESYQRQRKSDNRQTDFMMSALHHAYQGQSPTWLGLRGLGMNVINKSGALKAWLINQATGSTKQ